MACSAQLTAAWRIRIAAEGALGAPGGPVVGPRAKLSTADEAKACTAWLVVRTHGLYDVGRRTLWQSAARTTVSKYFSRGGRASARWCDDGDAVVALMRDKLTLHEPFTSAAAGF